MFRKMNFLKHQLHKFQEDIDPTKAKVSDLLRVEELKEAIKACRDLLISCNQRLVYAQAKQKLALGENIDDLVSDGNMSLMRAVEKFDYARGNKFSTYATWAIMKNFARSIPDAKTHKQRYMTGPRRVVRGEGGRADGRAGSAGGGGRSAGAGEPPAGSPGCPDAGSDPHADGSATAPRR